MSIAMLSPFQVKSNYMEIAEFGEQHPHCPHMYKKYGKITAGDPQAKKKGSNHQYSVMVDISKSWVKWNYGNRGPELAQLKPYSVLTFLSFS